MNKEINFNNLHLHDAELLQISFNYQKNELIVDIIKSESPNSLKKPFKLKFSEIYKILVDSSKPWGEGIYIFEHQIIDDEKMEDKNLKHFYFRTNAGDRFDIIAKKVEFIEL